MAGSNEVIDWKDADVNRETYEREDGHDDTAARRGLCQSRFMANIGQRRDAGRGQCEAADCLRTFRVYCQRLLADCRSSFLIESDDCSRPRLFARTGRIRQMFTDMDKSRLWPILGLFALADLPRLWP